MNKKFSTLVASLLLAGGIFTSAFAQGKINLSDAAAQGGYYSLKMDDNSSIDATANHIIVNGGKLMLDNVKKGTPAVAAGFWTAEEVNVNGTTGYAFVNAEGTKLTFNADGTFNKDGKGVYSAFTISGAQLYPVGKADMKLSFDNNKNVTLSTNAKYATVFTVATDDVTADVNNLLGDGFSLTIGKQVKNKKGEIVWDGAYENLKGNVFTGKLTAVETKKGSKKYNLKNEEGKYIVLTSENWGNLSNSLQGTGSAYDGFKFAAMSEAQIKEAEKADAKVSIKAKTFTITQPNMVTNEPLEVVAGNHYELMVAIVDGQAYLTTGDADAANSEEYLTGKASYTYEENTSKKVINNTYVIFGDGNDVDYAIFNDVVWNISWTNADDETLVAGPQCGNAWVPAAQVATAYPEGQWLYQGGNTFVNRESGNTMTISGLRKIEGKELTFSNSIGTYTFVQAGVPGHVTDAYLNGTDDEFLKEAFHIASPLAYGDTVYLAKDEKNALYLTKDKAEAVEFRMTKEVVKVGDNESDLIRHYTTYASAKAEGGFATDTLSLHRYFVSEASTNMYLSYDWKNEKYVLSETDGDNAIIFKNKAEKLYNLVQELDIVAHKNDKKEFLHWEYNNDFYYNNGQWVENKYRKAFCAASKLYGAHNSAELKKAVSAYEFIANDLFTLTKVDAGQHVSGIEGDTIKIFRNIDNNYVLYESGKLLADAKGDAVEGFLAIQNFLDPKYADKNAAMYVDGAAGLDTWRPEYMLVLDGKKVDAQNDLCSICGKPTCEHSHVSRGYFEGRYLVNLVDSAKAGRKDCMFQNYGGNDYYRLGFVHAKHIGDSLVIASSNDTLNLTGNSFDMMNVCEFAFHYVDKAREAFTIETAYTAARASKEDVLTGKADYVGELLGSKPGWVKFHNGIPVVTNEEDEAEVFNLELTSENPTANEEVAVSEVSVVAVDGAVVVKGAAGKTVAISNILGQTIANTVIASDNETIAVPAGIVVVAVEGEEAVKAIVR